MPDDNFGERAATESEITAWVALVKAGKLASQGYRVRDRSDDQRDSMRPAFGSDQASYEGD